MWKRQYQHASDTSNNRYVGRLQSPSGRRESRRSRWVLSVLHTELFFKSSCIRDVLKKFSSLLALTGCQLSFTLNGNVASISTTKKYALKNSLVRQAGRSWTLIYLNISLILLTVRFDSKPLTYFFKFGMIFVKLINE